MRARVGNWLLLTVGAAVFAGLMTVPAAQAEVTDQGRMIVASTPDDPFFGGRLLDLPLRHVYNEEGVFAVSYHRVNEAGEWLIDDPSWGIRSDIVTELEPNTEYVLDGEDDLVNLHDEYTFVGEHCPDLQGTLTVHELERDEIGVTSLSATFTLHCRPTDTVFGSLSYNAELLPLPDTASPIVQREDRFPPFVSEFYEDLGWANTFALDVGADHVRWRWDSPGGFGCASAVATTFDEEPVFSYYGRDDTGVVRDLDRHTSYRFGVNLTEPVEPCTLDPTLSSWESVLPLTVSFNTTTAAKSGHILTRGRVFITSSPDYSEPGRFLEVQIKGRKPDGSVAALGTAQTDGDGRFQLTVDPRRAQRMWAAVKAGSEPSAMEHRQWHHWSARSEPQKVRVA